MFTIARGVGILLSLDDATKNRSLGHYAMVLVDIDLAGSLQEIVLVEREDFFFKVSIDYERLPPYYSSCIIIGHSLSNCRNKKYDDGTTHKKIGSKYVKKYEKPDSIMKDHINVTNMEIASEAIPEKPVSKKGKEVVVVPDNALQGEASIRHDPIEGPDIVIDTKLSRVVPEDHIIRPAADLEPLDAFISPEAKKDVESVFDEMHVTNQNNENVLKDLDRMSKTFYEEDHEMQVEDSINNSNDSVRGHNLVTPSVHPNSVVLKDLEPLKGRLWSDELEQTDSIENISKAKASSARDLVDEGPELQSGYTKVLTKSQKKKLRQTKG